MRARIRLSILVALLASACDPVVNVETGQPFVEGSLIVSIDNPDYVVTNVKLEPAQTKWNGQMAREIEVAANGHQIFNGDFVVLTDNGDGSAQSSGVSAFASVRDERLPARPDAEGHYESPSRVEFRAQGLRVGYTPLDAQLLQIEPNGSWKPQFDNPGLILSPSVALVPVQAVIVYNGKDAQGNLLDGMNSQRLTQQLAFWDRVPSPETTNITDGSFGEITSVIRNMAWYRRDNAGQYVVGTQTAPDTVWDKCGVQFRLVNYFDMQVPLRNVLPVRGDAASDPNRFWPNGTLDDAPLRENLSLARRHPRNMDGVVTVIFMARVGFSDAPEVGRALIGTGAVGVSLIDGRGTSGTVAHELGHLSGLRDADGTEKDSSGSPLFNVMVGAGAGTEPTDVECGRMKQWAEGFRNFWNRPPPRPRG